MKKLTKEEKNLVQGGTVVYQCFGSGHKWGMVLYDSNALFTHYKKFPSHSAIGTVIN